MKFLQVYSTTAYTTAELTDTVSVPSVVTLAPVSTRHYPQREHSNLLGSILPIHKLTLDYYITLLLYHVFYCTYFNKCCILNAMM